MKQPLFLVFEGIDGAGTTTQAQRLYDRLVEQGHTPILTREPGGTPLAERIRTLVLDPAAGPVDNVTELLLYAAGRRQHVVEVIAPNLTSGKPVISDRYAASTVAYQGVGRGLGAELANTVNAIATGITLPDLTICLDLRVDVATDRRRERGLSPDRLEQAGDRLQESVRSAYLDLAASTPEAWLVINADAPPDTVTERIWSQLNERFPLFPFR